MELNELKILAQKKGYKIEHQEHDLTTIFEIRLKDETLIFGRCELGYFNRIKAHQEMTAKLQELLN